MNPDFTFRSPLPKVADSETDKDFAKAAILAEMRRRMAEEPNPTANATLGEFSFVAVPAPVGGGAKKRGREDRDDEASETKEDTSATSVAAKFDRVHRKQFDKYVFHGCVVDSKWAHVLRCIYLQDGIHC